MESLTTLPLRALVVDDELVAQKMIVFALESEQFLCDTAYDGEEAFEKFKLLQHDLVVTDLRMPNRDGRHLVLDLTAARPRPTVVVHTADADPGQTRELMAMGVDDIVFKPVHYPAFAAKAHCLVMRRRATSFGLQDTQDSLGPDTRKAAGPLEPTSPPIAKEREIDRRYRVEREIGAGMTSTVYLARDRRLDRQVALKILNVNGRKDDLSLLRFQREARAAAALRHTHICPVYDLGESDGTRYLVMAYIDGQPLSDSTIRDRFASESDVICLMRKLAAALQHAHDHDVVHRDLKPSNIMIDRRGEPVITDFGLATLLGEDAVHLTQTGALVGTPAYMSPEQALGETRDVGLASDIYSLGVIMFELLTGRYPFEGPVVAVLRKIVEQPTPSARDFRRDLNPELSDLCLAMMAKAKQARPGSMRDVERRLAAILPPPNVPIADPADDRGCSVATSGAFRTIGHPSELPAGFGWPTV